MKIGYDKHAVSHNESHISSITETVLLFTI